MNIRVQDRTTINWPLYLSKDIRLYLAQSSTKTTGILPLKKLFVQKSTNLLVYVVKPVDNKTITLIYLIDIDDGSNRSIRSVAARITIPNNFRSRWRSPLAKPYR